MCFQTRPYWVWLVRSWSRCCCQRPWDPLLWKGRARCWQCPPREESRSGFVWGFYGYIECPYWGQVSFGTLSQYGHRITILHSVQGFIRLYLPFSALKSDDARPAWFQSKIWEALCLARTEASYSEHKVKTQEGCVQSRILDQGYPSPSIEHPLSIWQPESHPARIPIWCWHCSQLAWIRSGRSQLWPVWERQMIFILWGITGLAGREEHWGSDSTRLAIS